MRHDTKGKKRVAAGGRASAIRWADLHRREIGPTQHTTRRQTTRKNTFLFFLQPLFSLLHCPSRCGHRPVLFDSFGCFVFLASGGSVATWPTTAGIEPARMFAPKTRHEKWRIIRYGRSGLGSRSQINPDKRIEIHSCTPPILHPEADPIPAVA